MPGSRRPWCILQSVCRGIDIDLFCILEWQPHFTVQPTPRYYITLQLRFACFATLGRPRCSMSFRSQTPSDASSDTFPSPPDMATLTSQQQLAVIGSFFLGPQSENSQILADSFEIVVDEIEAGRMKCFPADPVRSLTRNSILRRIYPCHDRGWSFVVAYHRRNDTRRKRLAECHISQNLTE
jgi:hypothetical protein